MGSICVKAVTRLTGLNANTIRSWERRYGAIRPDRSRGGRRTFTLEGVERLRLLGGLVRQGHAIGAIARLDDDALRELLGQRPEPDVLTRAEPAAVTRMLERTLDHLATYRLDAMSRELERARLHSGARSYVLDVVAPLLREVGMLVGRKALGVAQEHAISALLRAQLGQTLHQQRAAVADGHPVTHAIATPEGDHHELGILVGAVLLSSHGVPVHYLGPNLPATAYAEAVRALRVRVAIVGCTQLSRRYRKQAIADYARALAEALPRGCEIWLGGLRESQLGGKTWRRKVRCLPGFRDLDELLARQGG